MTLRDKMEALVNGGALVYSDGSYLMCTDCGNIALSPETNEVLTLDILNKDVLFSYGGEPTGEIVELARNYPK